MCGSAGTASASRSARPRRARSTATSNANPRLALSIVDPENPLRYLEIRGVVDRIEEDPDLDFINSMSEKYLGIGKYPNHRPGDERVVVFVRPEHTTMKDR
jgi:hypothetical protein